MASSPTRMRMSPDHVLIHRCESRKVAYRTKARALDAAEKLMEAGRVEPGCHITPYECELCGEWHVYNRRVVSRDGRIIVVTQ